MKALYQKQDFDTAPDLEEVIFANRNHTYGAYYLRKKYNKHMIVSFLITSSVVAAMCIPMLIRSQAILPVTRVIPVVTIPLEMVDTKMLIPPPPPASPQIPKSIIKQSEYTLFKVVDSVPPDRNSDFLTNLPIPVTNGGNEKVQYVDTSKVDVEFVDITKPFIKVEEEAIFQGGTLNDFRIWVGKHLVFPANASEMDIVGKVFVQFVVNTQGKVEDLKILKGVDPILDKEAIRVIANSPKWIPAKQRGIEVKQQFILPISFKLQKSI
jgi:periplasmic protein TonB